MCNTLPWHADTKPQSTADVPTGWSPPSPCTEVTFITTIQAFPEEFYFIGLLCSREVLPLDVQSFTLRWSCMPAIQKKAAVYENHV